MLHLFNYALIEYRFNYDSELRKINGSQIIKITFKKGILIRNSSNWLCVLIKGQNLIKIWTKKIVNMPKMAIF